MRGGAKPGSVVRSRLPLFGLSGGSQAHGDDGRPAPTYLGACRALNVKGH
jgi:hypothetical protein